MKRIVDLAKNRGFVFQGSEIYGGLANTWDYGPLGSLLKENLKNLWIREFVQRRPDMVLLDAAILMNPNVWVASGHVGGFSDPLIDDKNTKERFRADKLMESLFMEREEKGISRDDQLKDYASKYGVNNLVPESWTPEQQFAFMTGEKVENPNTKKPGDWTEIRKFNLMFKTSQGVTEDSSAMVYLRPETAQGIFVDFPNIVRTCRRRVPFGVAQVGKAFRNEITPGNFIFRTREFEQMEIEFFCEPGTQLEWHEKWKVDCKKFLMDTVGIKESNLRFREHEKDELSHYSDGTFDIEYDFPSIGFSELQGIASRTDFDLKAHMSESKQDMSYFDPVKNTKFVPYVIEPSIGLTRLFLATLCDAYDTVKEEDGNDRIVLRLKPEVAPVKIAVLPLVKKLNEKAEEVFQMLSKHFMTWYDETGSIGKRYARFDEIGTPWCVTIDFDNSLEKNAVTIRDRDTAEQVIVPIDELVEYFQKALQK
ncbi:glycine--tRNA ligase [Candidatus Gracilibacteria bacterium]|nr:glycine--tRNA ligase [Candidatus Gracilibacteria bacterium]